jgi:hypothetical protein
MNDYQINGTRDVRNVFKEAVGCSGRNFVRGTTSTDAHTFLRHVSNLHYKSKGKKVTYKFIKLGYNNEWSLEYLQKNLCKEGKYILFGATIKNNPSHKLDIKKIHNQISDSDKMNSWQKIKSVNSDHAVAVHIDDKMMGTIYDNGCVSGKKCFSFDNLVSRMRYINHCFLFDIYEC